MNYTRLCVFLVFFCFLTISSGQKKPGSGQKDTGSGQKEEQKPAKEEPTPPIIVRCPRTKTSDVKYSNGRCSKFYYSCTNGEGSLIECLDGVFDPTTNGCEDEENVLECKKFDVECSKGPANFANPEEPCSNIFVSCLPDGSNIGRKCAGESTRYDVASDSCQEVLFVDACGGKSTPKPDKPSKGSKNPSNKEDQPEEEDTICEELEDDDYESADCSPLFISCTNGLARKKLCPGKVGTLAFDESAGVCLEKKYVISCGGSVPETGGQETTPPPIPTVPFKCEVLKDFALEVGACSNAFVTCMEEGDVGLLRKCPAGTYFDEEIDECHFYKFVPVCSGKPRPIETVPQRNNKPTPRPDFDCSGLHDGNYAAKPMGCHTFFYSCRAEVAIYQPCPTGLFFNEGENECRSFKNTPACTGNPSKDDKTQEDQTQEIGGVDQPQETQEIGVDQPQETQEETQEVQTQAPHDGKTPSQEIYTQAPDDGKTPSQEVYTQAPGDGKESFRLIYNY